MHSPPRTVNVYTRFDPQIRAKNQWPTLLEHVAKIVTWRNLTLLRARHKRNDRFRKNTASIVPVKQ